MTRTGTLAGVALAATCVLALAACKVDDNDPKSGRTNVPLPDPTGTTQAIREENLVHLWPFTVNSGTLECRVDRALFIAPDGTEYALNDQARNAGAADPDPIRLKVNGEKVSLGAIRSKAIRLCDNH